MKIKLKSKKGGALMSLKILALVPGDTEEDASVRVEYALREAHPEGKVENKKLKSVKKELLKFSKKKTGWDPAQAKKDAMAREKNEGPPRGAERGGGSPADRAAEQAAAKSAGEAARDKAAADTLAGGTRGKTFEHTFSAGSIGLGLDRVYGSQTGNGVEVHRVVPGKQADQANQAAITDADKIVIGDKLIKVAGVDVSNMPLGKPGDLGSVLGQIVDAARPVTLTFERSGDGIFSAEFGEGRIGLGLDNRENTEGKGVEILSIAQDSLAEKDGQVQVGDKLVHVADHNATHLSSEQTMELLKSEPRPVTLTFRREGAGHPEHGQLLGPVQPAPEGAAPREVDPRAVEEAARRQKEEADRQKAEIAAKSEDEKSDREKAIENPDNVVPLKITDKDPNRPQPLGGDNSKRPLVIAAQAVMQALRRMALGTDAEQEDIRKQIQKENEALAADMKAAAASVFGKKGQPTEEDVKKVGSGYHSVILIGSRCCCCDFGHLANALIFTLLRLSFLVLPRKKPCADGRQE